MLLAWLTFDLVLVVLLAAALPLAFLYFIRKWLRKSEPGPDQNPPPGH